VKTDDTTTEIVPIEEVTSYYRIAYESYLKAQELVKHRSRHERKVEQRGKGWTEQDLDFMVLQRLTRADEERLSVVAIIFCALALEALINDYAVTNSSVTFFKRYLDRFPVLSKWLIFPQLAGCRKMNTDGQTFQKLKCLFRLRNRLVHVKGQPLPIPERGQKKRITLAQAKKAAGTVRAAVKQLRRLDKRVSILWIRDTEDACTS